jgi:spore maturation protein CgeB
VKILRVLTFKGRGISRSIISSINSALKELGHSVKCIDQREIPKGKAEEVVTSLISDIREFDPHLAIFYGIYGIIPVKTPKGETTLFDLLKVPYASLFFDDPFISFPVYSKYRTSPFYHIFVFDRAYIPRLNYLGFTQVHQLSIGTDPHIFRKIPLDEDDLRRYGSELSFVGHIFLQDEFSIERKDWNPTLNRIVDEVTRMKLRRMDLPVPLILNEFLKSLSQEEREWMMEFMNTKSSSYLLCQIYKECDSLHRKRIIDGLDMKIDLYGVEEEISSNARLCGRIEYGEELAKLYNATKINLNITTTQSISSPTQRIFDVTACGGFILTDYHKELENLFKVGEEIICYRDIKDLNHLIHHYLRHPDEREEVALMAHQRTLQHHTYRHRMEELLEKLKV